MSANGVSAAPSNMNKRTCLDRSLTVVYHNRDSVNITPSRRQGVDGTTERLYRLYGASLIQQACRLLSSNSCGMRSSTAITAGVIFQRLHHCISFSALDVWAAAMGALFCAAKTEEIPLTARQVIVVFHHLYQRRRLLLVENQTDLKEIQEHSSVVAATSAAELSFAEKQQKLKAEIAALSSTGPIWKEWFDALVNAEGQILRSLGFLLYWIPNEHAHRFIPGFLRALKLAQDDALAQKVWNACNDAYRLDVCVRSTAEVICTAAIIISLEARHYQQQLDDSAWWIVLIGPNREQELADCANILRGIQGHQDNVADSCIAEVAFLKPIVKESFNGPGSFLWEMAEGNL